MYESNSNNRSADRDAFNVTSTSLDSAAIDPSAEETTAVSKTTPLTLMSGEKIIEALTIATLDIALTCAHIEEISTLSEGAKKKVSAPPRNPIFEYYGGIGPEEYVLKAVRAVRGPELEDALLVLPFGKVSELIGMLNFWAQKVRSRSHSFS